MPAKKVTIATKASGDQLQATEVNQLTTAINAHASDLDALALVPPNRRRGLLMACRYLTTAELQANGNFGQALDTLDYANCCVQTRVLVEFYQPDPAGPLVRNQELVAIYDPAATNRVFVDGSFKNGEQVVPVRWAPAESEEARYGYVRRDTNPATITNWRVGELSIWSLNGKDEFATLKQAGGPFPAFTGVDNGYYKPAAPPERANVTLVPRLFLSLAQAQDLLATSRVVAGQPYQVEYNVASYPGTVLVNGGPDGDSFEQYGLLLDASGVPAGQVVVNVGAGTYALRATGGGAPKWVAGKQFADSLVYNDGVVWRVKQDIGNSTVAPTHAAPNAQYYEYVGGAEVLAALATVSQHTQQIGTNTSSLALLAARVFGRNRGPWAATTAYLQYDFVTYQGVQYYANQAFTSGASFTAANWTQGAYSSVSNLPFASTTQAGVVKLNSSSSGGIRVSGTSGVLRNEALYYTRDTVYPAYTGSEEAQVGFGFTCAVNGHPQVSINTSAGITGDVLAIRNLGTQSTKINANGFTLDGQADLSLEPGGWIVLKKEDTNISTVERGSLSASGSSAQTSQLLAATYTASQAGAQTITQAGATAFFDVGWRTTGGQVYALSQGTGYTVSGSTLTILAAVGVQAGQVIEYAYLTGAAPGAGGTTSSSGIDYANPITLSAATTLAVNKAYFVTGSGYALSLPASTGDARNAIFLAVADTATGTYPVSRASLTLYPGETMIVRDSPDGWRKTGGDGNTSRNGNTLFQGSTGNFTVATSPITVPANGFYFLPMQDRPIDVFGKWDAGSNSYEIPISGDYLVITKVLPAQGSQNTYVGRDFYCGPAIGAPGDNEHGNWEQVSSTSRRGIKISTATYYNAGAKVGLAHYQENGGYGVLCSIVFILTRAY